MTGGSVWIELADSFEVVLQQPADGGPPDKSNILVHGIGVAAQGRGIDPATALDRFVAFVGGSPLLGFHVEFDRRLIDRATQGVLGSQVAPAPGWTSPTSRRCCSPVTARARWTTGWTACGIECAQRHQAAADTLATAELLLHLWPAARAEGVADFRGLSRLAARRRWLS